MARFLLLTVMFGARVAMACDDDGKAEAGEKSGEHCQMPSAETIAPLAPGGTHTTLAVTGMHCGTCADKVHTALMAVPGVSGARVDLTAGTVEIAWDPAKTTLDKLKAAVKAAGFTAAAQT